MSHSNHHSSRYHITTKPAPAPFDYPITFRKDKMDDYVKYGHQGLPNGRHGGDPHWTPQIITQTWFQAETGNVPISGAGYGGAFAEGGFDAIWLDMSEIVRPTRDGIHGREYISTVVDLGPRPLRLHFSPDGKMMDESPHMLTLPVPIFLDTIPMDIPGRAIHLTRAQAAHELGIRAFIKFADLNDDLLPYQEAVVPLLEYENQFDSPFVQHSKLVELSALTMERALELYKHAVQAFPDADFILRIPLNPSSVEIVDALVREGCPMVHLVADELAREQNGERFLTEVVEEIHNHLVEEGLRDQISLIVSGGIAIAEHMPKAIICGADAIAIDFVIMLALGCGLWADVRHGCKIEAGKFDPEWGAQRLMNLINAWRDQLLEVMGAMGIREVRRHPRRDSAAPSG